MLSKSWAYLRCTSNWSLVWNTYIRLSTSLHRFYMATGDICRTKIKMFSEFLNTCLILSSALASYEHLLNVNVGH